MTLLKNASFTLLAVSLLMTTAAYAESQQSQQTSAGMANDSATQAGMENITQAQAGTTTSAGMGSMTEQTVSVTEYAVGTSTPSDCTVKYVIEGTTDEVIGAPTALGGEAMCAALLAGFNIGAPIKIELDAKGLIRGVQLKMANLP